MSTKIEKSNASLFLQSIVLRELQLLQSEWSLLFKTFLKLKHCDTVQFFCIVIAEFIGSSGTYESFQLFLTTLHDHDLYLLFQTHQGSKKNLLVTKCTCK